MSRNKEGKSNIEIIILFFIKKMVFRINWETTQRHEKKKTNY